MWGIEVSEESVACALENAELNGITNAAFFAGNVGQVVEELLERSGAPDVVVVDPPRAGLAGKALRRLGEIGAPRIVYVSCNPTTLAGDVKVLREEYGYELLRATPVDMFPHTPHVETVALLEKSPLRVRAPSRQLGHGGHAWKRPCHSGCGPERTAADDERREPARAGPGRRSGSISGSRCPAWLLGFAAVGLGFLMVLRGYDSAAGWFAVSTAIILR